MFSCYILLTDHYFIFWFLLLLEVLSNMFLIIICMPVCDVINFENFCEAIFLHVQKWKNEKVFFITFEGFPLKQIKATFFLCDESLTLPITEANISGIQCFLKKVINYLLFPSFQTQH